MIIAITKLHRAPILFQMCGQRPTTKTNQVWGIFLILIALYPCLSYPLIFLILIALILVFLIFVSFILAFWPIVIGNIDVIPAIYIISNIKFYGLVS